MLFVGVKSQACKHDAQAFAADACQIYLDHVLPFREGEA